MSQEVLGIVAKKVKINFQDIRRVGYAVPCPYVFFYKPFGTGWAEWSVPWRPPLLPKRFSGACFRLG